MRDLALDRGAQRAQRARAAAAQVQPPLERGALEHQGGELLAVERRQAGHGDVARRGARPALSAADGDGVAPAGGAPQRSGLRRYALDRRARAGGRAGAAPEAGVLVEVQRAVSVGPQRHARTGVLADGAGDALARARATRGEDARQVGPGVDHVAESVEHDVLSPRVRVECGARVPVWPRPVWPRPVPLRPGRLGPSRPVGPGRLGPGRLRPGRPGPLGVQPVRRAAAPGTRRSWRARPPGTPGGRTLRGRRRDGGGTPWPRCRAGGA